MNRHAIVGIENRKVWQGCNQSSYRKAITASSILIQAPRALKASNRVKARELCSLLRTSRVSLVIGYCQTPHRFRTKRPLWNYGGLAIEMHSSADHRSVDGHLQRSQKNVLVRGLNRNCNHDLKNLFKGAAVIASSKPGPFQEFYAALLAKGMRPEMARLTLARKIATIVLIVWKRGVCFDAQYLKPQTA
jgi:nitrogen-specific signal transduction histidine kinase